MSELPAELTLDAARRLDAEDPLRAFRDEFLIPSHAGRSVTYLCGNSLGLQPRGARALVEQELDDWATLGVEAHFRGRTPWYSYHEVFREPAARVVGAVPGEVVMMNGLTTNVHLLLTSFYRPEGSRTKILTDAPAFPSDTYALRSHVRARGLDPDQHIIALTPREGEEVLRTEDIIEAIELEGHRAALLFMAGVNFLTGQALDIGAITAAAHARGFPATFDLAHAAGNLDLRLHDWGVDAAAWCSYKYLNGSPGAIAGFFVHERHAHSKDRPRLGGWWGNDPATRFRMHLEPEFIPRAGADGWQLSNPPILAMAPLRASLALFDRAGMRALRAKSLRLTGFLRALLEHRHSRLCRIITPREDEAHGCQLSIVVHDRPRERFAALERAGIVADFREPDVIRAAPVPLYNSFEDVWRLADAFAEVAAT